MDLHPKQAPRGTRILVDGHAERYRRICNTLISIAEVFGAREIMLPILDVTRLYHEAGREARRHMYTLFEPKTRISLCVRPEGTITCRLIADTLWKDRRDVRVFYITRCWRNERPQLGRYHEFTQFGVEVLNPKKPEIQGEILTELATRMITAFTQKFSLNTAAQLKYAYYTGLGFEINCDQLGPSQSQVCAGGPYKQGYGFAIAVERVMLLLENGNGHGH